MKRERNSTVLLILFCSSIAIGTIAYDYGYTARAIKGNDLDNNSRVQGFIKQQWIKDCAKKGQGMENCQKMAESL